MGLLAFDPNTCIRRYQRLFSLSRWAGLIDQFRQENFALYQLSQRSVLSVTLQAGLSALKTPYPSNEPLNTTSPMTLYCVCENSFFSHVLGYLILVISCMMSYE